MSNYMRADMARVLAGLSLVAQDTARVKGPEWYRAVQQVVSHVEDLYSKMPHAMDTIQHAHQTNKPHTQPDGTVSPGMVTNTDEYDPIPQSSTARAPLDDADLMSVGGRKRAFKETAVPSSPLARVYGFGSLAAGMALGSANEMLKRAVGTSSTPGGSVVLTEANAERLASALCRMRGAALKIGQMISIQDDTIVPSSIQHVLERVRQNADIMPKHQLYDVLNRELGSDWRNELSEFVDTPIAAASIGQVHRAVLKDGTHVAMKVQYPGVAQSIDSDLDNLKRVLLVADIFPKGMYLDNMIQVAREELKLECQYRIEAAHQERFRQLVLADSQLADRFIVPPVVPQLSSDGVLTTHLIAGVPIDQAQNLDQKTRNRLARRMLRLTLKELFEFRFMQTDPNWGNFLYDERREMVGLLDFGAAREYSAEFVDEYLRLVWAAAQVDKEGVVKHSTNLRMLTGHESPVMLNAHIAAGLVVGEPFVSSAPYDFRAKGITARIQEHGSVFASHRLTPPPKEIYSLHRKLSGAFLICIRLGAVIPCRDLLEQTVAEYEKRNPTAARVERIAAKPTGTGTTTHKM